MKTVLSVFVLSLGLVHGVNAGQKIPLAAAEVQCNNRAVRYSHTIEGRAGLRPDDYKIQGLYRSCVHAKTGRYPGSPVSKRQLFVSGSISFGTIYEFR